MIKHILLLVLSLVLGIAVIVKTKDSPIENDFLNNLLMNNTLSPNENNTQNKEDKEDKEEIKVPDETDQNEEDTQQKEDKEETDKKEENKEENKDKQETDKKEENKDKEEDNKKEEDKEVESDKKEDKEETDKKDEEEPENNKDITVKYKVNYSGSTYTGLPSLKAVTYTVNNAVTLDNTSYAFSYGIAKNGKPHSITVNNQNRFDAYKSNALAWDNKASDKRLYLTFDCGYEYQNLTSEVLDILKEKNIKASFFVTGSFVKSSPNIVARMINEGHIVGSHSNKHKDSTSLTHEQLATDTLAVHNMLRVQFGYNDEYYRFPSGVYSEDTLNLIHNLGYKSVFWSVAYRDWDTDNQKGKDYAYETVTSRLHSGAVVLLHAVSKDNVEALSDIIDYATNEGYQFKSLNDYYK